MDGIRTSRHRDANKTVKETKKRMGTLAGVQNFGLKSAIVCSIRRSSCAVSRVCWGIVWGHVLRSSVSTLKVLQILVTLKVFLPRNGPAGAFRRATTTLRIRGVTPGDDFQLAF